MRGGSLSGRLARLEDAARKRQEDTRARYLRSLFAWIGAAREARQTGDTAKAEEARALRLEALTRWGQA